MSSAINLLALLDVIQNGIQNASTGSHKSQELYCMLVIVLQSGEKGRLLTGSEACVTLEVYSG